MKRSKRLTPAEYRKLTPKKKREADDLASAKSARQLGKEMAKLVGNDDRLEPHWELFLFACDVLKAHKLPQTALELQKAWEGLVDATC